MMSSRIRHSVSFFSFFFQLIEVMDRVTPGKFRFRGMILFELFVVSRYILQTEAGNGQPETVERLRELRGILSESAEILSIFIGFT